MNTERDLRENERSLVSSWHPAQENLPKRVFQVNGNLEGTEQDRNTEYASKNQTWLEDLDSQTTKVETDPELAAIAAQLQETALYAINPTFKEELHKNLLQQFVTHHTVETKPIEGIDEFPLPGIENPKALEQAFQEEELQLPNATPQSHENDFEHKTLVCRAYRYVKYRLKRFHGQSAKKSPVFFT